MVLHLREASAASQKGFLHPDITITQAVLAQIFLQKRCRNIACQAPLPANDCACKACSSDSGFCNMCMCISCFTFDFEANTCRWVGCDFCLHWCHSDCALHLGDVGITTSRASIQSAVGGEDLQYLCPACGHASELFGFVSDVFQNCAAAWKRDKLSRELACVERMFQHSTDPRGQRLSTWAQKLQMHLEGGASYMQVCRVMQRFFADNMTMLPHDPRSRLDISLAPTGLLNNLDKSTDTNLLDGSKVVNGQQCVPAMSGAAPSQSEAASSPLGHRNIAPCNLVLTGEHIPIHEQQANGSDIDNWTSMEIWAKRQTHSVHAITDELVNAGAHKAHMDREGIRERVAGVTEAQGKPGAELAGVAFQAEVRQTWYEGAMRNKEREVGMETGVAAAVIGGTSGADRPRAERREEERGRDLAIAVVGMEDQARALKRSRSIIDEHRENLAELQRALAELHKEMELEESSIMELEQRVARKQAEHQNLQKKADEALREMEAMRATLCERRSALSSRFNEQIARLHCDEAERRCSAVCTAMQLLVGSRERLDEAQDEVRECLQNLIYGTGEKGGDETPY